jgi:ribosomal protein RSM22 (predicted rRNA methylase)
LVLAVTKMLCEILEDYRTESQLPLLACDPPNHFEIVANLEQEQEISHRILTAYNEIYAVLLRTHRQPSSSVWHRRATIQYFPQLTIETNSTEDSPPS